MPFNVLVTTTVYEPVSEKRTPPPEKTKVAVVEPLIWLAESVTFDPFRFHW